MRLVKGGGITLDSGVLIALERRKQKARALMVLAERDGLRVTVPSVVLTECWRGRSDAWEAILAAVDVEPVSDEVAKLAGEAIGAVPGASVVDAVVMASAALRGDAVYTSDFEDLQRLQAVFPTVRVFRI